MTKAAEKILAEAMKLEPREAIEVAEMLIDSGKEPDHEKLWKDEIHQREEDFSSRGVRRRCRGRLSDERCVAASKSTVMQIELDPRARIEIVT